jgi:hypothetical protein
MTKNCIDAAVEFSFKGVDYHYTASLDLNLLFRQHDEMPSIHVILARAHNVDTYSYLYEVMQEAEIAFSNPQGAARDYVVDDEFDQSALAANWQNAHAVAQVQPIAEAELGITSLDLHPDIKRALVAAYILGKLHENRAGLIFSR